eukprot:7319289-Lingulodinium_polyedra.AAC.1
MGECSPSRALHAGRPKWARALATRVPPHRRPRGWRARPKATSPRPAHACHSRRGICQHGMPPSGVAERPCAR